MSLLEHNHRYSFTQLSAFDECPFGFYLARIEKAEPVSNAFSELGALVHELIYEWAKGNLTIDQLPAEYEKRYPERVVTQYPRMLAAKGYTEKSFEQGLDYFINFDGFAGYEIVDAELPFTTEISGRPFVGVIDMILKDELTGELIVLDHKSKSLASFKKVEKEMYRQQYLYSKFVYERFRKWPDRLAFNLFKENGVIKYQPFDKQTYEETLQWATDIIEKIESYEMIDWMDSKDKPDFFCQYLCNVRTSCPNGR